MSYHTLPCLRIILLRLAPFRFAIATRCSELFCYATAKLLSGKPLPHIHHFTMPLRDHTKLGTAFARPCLTLPCLCKTMSDLAFATQTSLYYSISSQNITSHCLCLSLLNVTLPLQNSTVICLHHASPCFAIADLHLVSHRHRFTELDLNVHCLCSSLLNDTLPPLNPAPQHHTLPLLDRNIHCHRLAVLHHGRAKQCRCRTAPRFALAVHYCA